MSFLIPDITVTEKKVLLVFLHLQPFASVELIFENNSIFYHPAALYCSMVIAGYISVCVQLYCNLVFIVFHYVFWPTWPSSGV
jgi:hypothetical protein